MLGGRVPSRQPGGPDLERYLFWRGQLLRSRDLIDLAAGEEERLFWHNRAIHDAYGVVVGLRVDAGAGAPPEVTVHPGFAYDAYGRELAVFAPTPVPRPQGVGGGTGEEDDAWVLLLRHRERAAGGCGCSGNGCGCGGAGVPRSELVWRRARRAGLKDGVVLARGRWISGTAGWLFLPDDGFAPLLARPFARPRLGHGETPPGGTAWRPWLQPVDPRIARADVTGGIEVSVDTSAAGFVRTPCYFAWLQGGLWQVPHRLVRTVPLERITAATRDRFTFSLWDPTESSLLALARQRLYVCWLGVEMEPTGLHVKPSAHVLRRLDSNPR